MEVTQAIRKVTKPCFFDGKAPGSLVPLLNIYGIHRMRVVYHVHTEFNTRCSLGKEAFLCTSVRVWLFAGYGGFLDSAGQQHGSCWRNSPLSTKRMGWARVETMLKPPLCDQPPFSAPS